MDNKQTVKKETSIKEIIKKGNLSEAEINESFNRLVRFCYILSEAEAEAEINSNK